MEFRKILTLSILSVILCSIYTPSCMAVEVTITEGMYNETLKKKMERSLSILLTEINGAHEQNRTPNYGMLKLPTDVETTISALWDNSPFFCIDDQVIEKCLKKGYGDFQIRNIPLLLTDGSEGEDYQEAVVTFDSNGNIKNFNLTIGRQLYMDILKQGLDITDRAYRELILDWTEQFRTAYNEHNIDFLDAVFSDDALIITGKTMERRSAEGITYTETEYTSKSKTQYLTDLKRVFNNDKKNLIKVLFDDIKIMRHPNPDFNKMYGVTLHQKYTSATYSDDGHLFLLWDFTDENHPKIHVRVWQEQDFDDIMMAFDFDDLNN